MSDATPSADPYKAPAAPLSPADEKLWATLIHVGGIFLYVIPSLVGYLLLRERGPFIRAQSAAALNFQITAAIGYLVSFVLTAILIGYVTAVAIWVLSVVFSIIAGLAANRGEAYTYPLSFKFVS
ncbi:DUF4870 domain-containing protein [Cryobacterium sp. CG_9.6]|uniref:DUF4870 domain-containing protein n=1 Tax=Cryobacterium sp. CG_9.6 TaxID=2760710 RepID=UPI002473E905|nr:DUF4870 domain-containing protein [Cryobacterium sp. CG_9.6]MDH6237180.1 putative Tic20 family protein [Cryobacterium sp. CG_9.6]